jgi:hypothetical protein
MKSNDFIKSSIATAVLVIGFILFWEFYWRSKGFIITYNEDKVMWTHARKKVYEQGGQTTVFVGDSRVKFDIDLATWKAETGEDPVQLALVGTSPRPILNNLANDEKFRGNVIWGGSEIAIYAMDSATREGSAKDGIEYFKKETPAQKLNASLDFMLESKLVFLEEGKFGLNALLYTLPIPNRPGVIPRPGPPRAFSNSDFARQSSLSPMLFKDTAVRNATIRYWASGATRNKQKIIKGDTLEAYFNQLKNSIDRIRARGGKVFIIRPPSTGPLLARENMLYPRNQYWDKLLQYTQMSGFYFTDYPEIAHMDCPEQSHLSHSDAVIFTRTLIRVLKEKEGWTFPASSDSLTSQHKQ